MMANRIYVSSWIFRAVLAVGFLLICLFFYWYETSFISRLDELKLMGNRGVRSVEKVKSKLYILAVSAETESGIRQWAIRQAYASLVIIPVGGEGTISSQLNIGLWIFASNIHLTDDQVFGLWVDCAIYSCGEGLGGASRKYLKKELNNLSAEELASIVAMVKNPFVYMPGTVRGDQRAKDILDKI